MLIGRKESINTLEGLSQLVLQGESAVTESTFGLITEKNNF